MLILIIINVHGILAIYWTNRTSTCAENALYCPHDVMVKPLRYQLWAEMLDYINAQFNCVNMRGNMYVINKVRGFFLWLREWQTRALWMPSIQRNYPLTSATHWIIWATAISLLSREHHRLCSLSTLVNSNQ
jgi:hypothetical protein